MRYDDAERDCMKIYTGRGDNGTTELFSGERVPKSHERIDAIGDIDELNSALGLLCVYLLKEKEGVSDFLSFSLSLFIIYNYEFLTLRL